MRATIVPTLSHGSAPSLKVATHATFLVTLLTMSKFTQKLNTTALLSVLTASALTLSACSDTSSNDSNDEAAENTVATDGSDSSGDSAGKDDESSDSSDSDVETPGAPDGFSPTKADSRLKLGDTASIILPSHTTDSPAYFEVTVAPPEEKSVEEIEEIAAGQLTDHDYSGFKCFTATFKYLGIGPDAEEREVVLAPRLRPIGDGGRNANYIAGSAELLCGIHDSEELPESTADLEEGKEYKLAAIGFTEKSDGGIDPTGIKLVSGKPNSAYPENEIYFE